MRFFPLTPESWEGADRRAYRRIPVSPGVLRVEIGPEGQLPTLGIAIDISRGGLKVTLDRRAFEGALGEGCTLRFVDVEGRIEPRAVRGRVRRAEATRNLFSVAIEFEHPLEVLRIGDAVGGSSPDKPH